MSIINQYVGQVYHVEMLGHGRAESIGYNDNSLIFLILMHSNICKYYYFVNKFRLLGKQRKHPNPVSYTCPLCRYLYSRIKSEPQLKRCRFVAKDLTIPAMDVLTV